MQIFENSYYNFARHRIRDFWYNALVKNRRTYKVALLVERSRAFGREACEGVIAFAQEREDWELHFLDADDVLRRPLRKPVDGYIARVTTDDMAAGLIKTGKPVVDLYYEKPRQGFAIVKTMHETVGRIAAEHFIDRRFSNFAYCPYGGGRTSKYCQTAFARRLRRNGFSCAVYPGESDKYEFGKSDIISDTISPPKDAKRLSRWLASLPKPVALFCPGDLRAWQVVALCRSKGIDVPREVAVLGLDNDMLICGSSRPMLSSIDPNTREIGRVAAETLAEMMERGVPKKQVVRQIAPCGVVSRASTESFPVEPPWLSDALVFIIRNAHKGINASDVFAALGRSHTTVTKAFREVLGTSVVAAVAKARIDEACRLLRDTDLDVERIASMSGYASVSYFMQAFKASKGTSPCAWRKSNAMRTH